MQAADGQQTAMVFRILETVEQAPRGGIGEYGVEQRLATMLQPLGEAGRARVVFFGGVANRVGFQIPAQFLPGLRVERRGEGLGRGFGGVVALP
jgi:hypothetical protein